MKLDLREMSAVVALMAQTNLNMHTLGGEAADTYWDIMADADQLRPYRLLATQWENRVSSMDQVRWPDERAATELSQNIRQFPALTPFTPPARLAMARIFMLYVRYC